MAVTPSTMLPLGTRAPGFRLLEPATGREVGLDDFSDAPALLVMFICNHCPYVKHVRAGLAALTAELQRQGVAVVGINSNDVEHYPDDAPDRMVAEVRQAGYSFPYLLDETQEVARAYRAACTPEFYLFDAARELVYRGQMDDSRPGNNIPVTGGDLREAARRALAGEPQAAEQKPGIGCNIKWKAGNEPDYFG
jgi:peroxiredoxin